MRKLLVVLVVLAVILVGADFGGRWLAERAIAQQVSAHVGGSPRVEIRGFSFLYQAVRGNYREIDVTLPGVPAGPLPSVDATLRLTGVALPLSDAIGRRFQDLTAQRGSAAVTIPAVSLGAVLGRSVTLRAGPDGSVQITTTANVLGRAVPVSGTLLAEVGDGGLRLGTSGLSAAGISLPSDVAAKLAGALSTTIPLRGLPFPVTSGTAAVEDGALVVTARAQDIQARAFLG